MRCSPPRNLPFLTSLLSLILIPALAVGSSSGDGTAATAARGDKPARDAAGSKGQDPTATDWCATSGPESVLSCLQSAYNGRDYDAYERLLSPEFRFLFVKDGTSWGRESDLTSTRTLFQNKSVRSMTYDIDGDPKVTPGERPNTWSIAGVTTAMHVETLVEGKLQPIDIRSESMVFIVERLEFPAPHFVIREWQDTGE